MHKHNHSLDAQDRYFYEPISIEIYDVDGKVVETREFSGICLFGDSHEALHHIQKLLKQSKVQNFLLLFNAIFLRFETFNKNVILHFSR